MATVRAVFERGTETFNAHDIDGFTALLSDDVVFHAPGGMSGRGRTACAGFYGSWLTAFPDGRVEIDALHITGEVAVEEGTFTGTHQGVLPGPDGDIAPTGRAVRLEYVQVLHVRDGKNVSFNLMFDRLALLEQLGLLPAPSPAS